MGGNGDYVKHGRGMMNIPPGQGGGCVTKGPFGKYVSNLPQNMSMLSVLTDHFAQPHHLSWPSHGHHGPRAQDQGQLEIRRLRRQHALLASRCLKLLHAHVAGAVESGVAHHLQHCDWEIPGLAAERLADHAGDPFVGSLFHLG
jgi:hypothetical protein